MQLPVCSSSLAQDDFPEQEALPPETQLLPPEDPELPPPEEEEPEEPEEEEPELPEPEEELEPEDDDELLELAGGGVGQEEQQVRVPPQPSEQE